MNLETIELTNSGKVTEGVNMRSEWINDENMNHVLAAMMPANRLAIEVSMATGLRIGDVLQLTREQAEKGRFTVYEAKTGKRRPVRLPTAIQRQPYKGAVWSWLALYTFSRPGAMPSDTGRVRPCIRTL